MNDIYKEVKVFTFENAVVRVHIPDITQDERNKRMTRIHDSAMRLLKTAERGRNERNIQ